MTLYFVGLGLWDEKDISLRGLSIVKKCKFVFLDNYTGVLNCDIKKFEGLYGKKIIIADRGLVEKKAEVILEKAKNENVAFLVPGEVFAATTHIDLFLRAKRLGIKIEIIHNASVLTAIGVTGLELYKFGKVTSIPFENGHIKTPYEVLEQNLKLGLHTLFLLDLDIKNKKFMTVNQGLGYLIKNGLKKETLCVGCAGLGSEKAEIKVGEASELMKEKFKKIPQCLIVPGKLHFMEEEALDYYK